MSALRVYDSDFTSEAKADLIDLAEELLSQYRGNWAELAAYKGKDLTAATARQVINMMATQAAYADHPAWRDIASLVVPMPVRYRRPPSTAVAQRQSEGRTLRMVPKPEPRKYRIDRPVKVKVPYGHPPQRNGKVHIIAAARCEWHLDRDVFGREDRDLPRVPELHVKWACNNGSMWRTSKNPVLVAEVPEDRERCPKCFGTQS